jgi:hypothetical protein
MKILALVAFVLILGCLGAALLFMLKTPGKTGKDDAASSEENVARGKRMATALGFRVAFSVSLFLLVLLLYSLGYIQPTGVTAGR